MGRGSSGSKASDSKKGGGSSPSLKQTEISFASFSNGEAVVAVNSNGDYRYVRALPNPDTNIDTSSAEYKRALSDYNVKAQFNSDGSVAVKKGGLYSRKTTFKSVDEFQRETNSRIDKQIKYYDGRKSSLLSGNISQIEAENFKHILQTNSSAQALRKINTSLKESITSYNTFIKAGADMKLRLDVLINKRKKGK